VRSRLITNSKQRRQLSPPICQIRKLLYCLHRLQPLPHTTSLIWAKQPLTKKMEYFPLSAPMQSASCRPRREDRGRQSSNRGPRSRDLLCKVYLIPRKCKIRLQAMCWEGSKSGSHPLGCPYLQWSSQRASKGGIRDGSPRDISSSRLILRRM
jgi:hypothetical protein